MRTSSNRKMLLPRTEVTERVEELFDRYLDVVLGGAAVEMEALLAEHPELADSERERLRRLAELVPAPALHGIPLSQVARRLVGAYRILRVLGHGGQGEVYLAEDTRFARRVAMKILSRRGLSGGGGDAALARLKREAEVVSRLDHPGICVVHELGADGDDLYITMRHVEGETLGQKIAAARAALRPSNGPCSQPPQEGQDSRRSL